MGRAPDLEKRRIQQEAFLAAFAKTGRVIAAAQQAGLHPPKHYQWLRIDADYARQFADLQASMPADGVLDRQRPGPKVGSHMGGHRGEKRLRSQAAFLEALAHCGILTDAAAEAGIHKQTYNYWVSTDEAFAARAEQAMAEGAAARKETVSGRLGASAKAFWSDPETRAAASRQRAGSWTPERRAAASERLTRRMGDPEAKDAWMAASDAKRVRSCDNYDYFDAIDTADKAYWLGFIGADGCIRLTPTGSRLVIKLARRDRDHLVLLHKALGAHRPIRDKDENGIGNKMRPVSILDVCCKEVAEALVRVGITPRKSQTYQPWDGPAELMPHYWRGLVDGDGSVGITSEGVQVTLAGTEAIVSGFCEWARAVCGTKATAHPAPHQGRFWRTNIAGTVRVLHLLAALYDDAPTALERKHAVAQLAVHGTPLAARLF
jgi:hypothetical protein